MKKTTHTRKPIPESVKLELWVKSAGRCQFKGCNKPVWYNGLTLSKGNFAEIAHIIGSSKQGPRGTDDSENLQTEFSNLMLLCPVCHKTIDDAPAKYPVALLQQWKQAHEDRIAIQTSYSDEIHKTTVLLCSVNIGERLVPINTEAVANAIFPKYPTDFKGIKIEENAFDRFATMEIWQAFAESKIKRKVRQYLEEGADDVKIKHLSVFGIAPMPFLFYLGKCIGDTIPCDIYQSHRNIEDTSKTWNWQQVEPVKTDYLASCEQENITDIVLLKLAISDAINADKYATLQSDNTAVYQITIPTPSVHFLQSKKHPNVKNLRPKKFSRFCMLTPLILKNWANKESALWQVRLQTKSTTNLVQVVMFSRLKLKPKPAKWLMPIHFAFTEFMIIKFGSG